MTSEQTSGAAAVPAGAGELWEISPASSLDFVLRHIVIQEIEGRFHRWGGVLLIDRNEPSRSRVDVWVELASIDTDSPDRDAHVRSEEFLDVARFPRARFVSTSIELDDERIHVHGELDLHGVVLPVELEVSPGPTSVDAHGVVHGRYLARGALDRQAFGLHWNQDLDVGGVVVGDRIELRASVDATLPFAGWRR